MMDFIRLKGDDLKIKFDSLPEFDLTTEILPFKDIIGQDRAIEAINRGLSIERQGYNIFICGNNGTGRKSYIMKRIKEQMVKKSEPCDWCYVYNFEENESPRAVSLPAGAGAEFKEDMKNFIDGLIEDVPKIFTSDEFEGFRNSIIEKYQKQVLEIVDKLYNESNERDFNVKSTNDGFAFTPVFNGEEMTEKQYNDLSDTEKEIINEKVSYLKILALDVIRKSKVIKKTLFEELKKLDEEKAVSIIGVRLSNLKEKYSGSIRVLSYLRDVEGDIIHHISAFVEEEDDEEETYDENFFKRYNVNIISSSSKGSGQPVVYENYPEYHNLFGKIEYENKSGSLTTDFTSIVSGSLHRANGGYIIIDAYQLLTSSHSWETLKRCLKCNSIIIENSKSIIDIAPVVSFKPEEIPLNIKVILIGSPVLYYILYNYDEDFKELFKIKADFEDEIGNNDGTAIKLLGFIRNYCDENNILPLSRDAVNEVLKFSLRKRDSKKYFTASMNNITDLLVEASKIAELKGSRHINEVHIKDFLRSYNNRYSIYRDKIYDMYKEGKFIIDIKGTRVGEVNGLTVIDYGDFSFGKQTRITVTTFAGKDGIINIERETKMSGNIHSKGIMILAGYIGETFGQDMPLSFNASICFEQVYGGIDGDSASAAELVALLSSLGNVPLKQNFAITGSVNQRGDIQPVGGINEKIEGFYDICSKLGLDGSQGVIIPFTNMDELLLKDEVIHAVEEGSFHIYAVKSIDDCFEILSGDEIKKNVRKRAFDNVKKRVYEKLKKYNDIFLNNIKE